MENNLVFTKHAIDRALERLMKIKSNATDKQKTGIEMILRKSITPFKGMILNGHQYMAKIDGFKNFRASILVELNGVHVVKSIVPIT